MPVFDGDAERSDGLLLRIAEAAAAGLVIIHRGILQR